MARAVTIAQNLEAAEQESQGLKQVHKQISLVLTNERPKRQCYCCGCRNHTAEACFYKDIDCHLCGKKGHLAKMYKSKLGQFKIR